MDASQVLWEKWHEQVKGLFPRLHGHQQKGLALLVAGMVVSGCAVLQRVAEDIQQQGWSQAKMSSIERRLERFVANEQVEVNEVWDTFLGQVLPYWQGQKLTFVLDCTPYNAQFTIVYVGLLVHSRVLPVVWVVMPQQEKWEERQWDLVARLLDRVDAFLPETECTLLADRGLVGAPLVRLCEERHWHYVLRICQQHTCRRQMGKHKAWSGWCSAEELYPHERPAVVWTCTGVARGDRRDLCECLLGGRVSRGMVDHFGSACWQEAASDLCVAHACRVHLSRYQDAWLEHRSRATAHPGPSGTLALSRLSSRLVGGSFGRFLHP